MISPSERKRAMRYYASVRRQMFLDRLKGVVAFLLMAVAILIMSLFLVGAI